MQLVGKKKNYCLHFFWLTVLRFLNVFENWKITSHGSYEFKIPHWVCTDKCWGRSCNCWEKDTHAWNFGILRLASLQTLLDVKVFTFPSLYLRAWIVLISFTNSKCHTNTEMLLGFTVRTITCDSSISWTPLGTFIRQGLLKRNQIEKSLYICIYIRQAFDPTILWSFSRQGYTEIFSSLQQWEAGEGELDTFIMTKKLLKFAFL